MSADWPYRCTGIKALTRPPVTRLTSCPALYRALPLDEGLHCGGRQIEGHRIDIAEHRPRAGARDGSGGREEGERGCNDFVTAVQSQCHQGKQQRVGARGNADAGRSGAIARDFRLQSEHVVAQNEALTGAHLLDDGHDFGANLGVLRLKIE